MWRIFSLASLVFAGVMAMWPAQWPRPTESARPHAQEKRHLIQVMHYGGNLICHDRFENNVVGSGNNLIGLARVEDQNKKSAAVEK